MPVERLDIDRHRNEALRLGKQMFLEAGRREWSDERYLSIIQQPNVYMCLYKKDDVYIGGMIGYVHREAQGLGDIIAQDLGFYIEPEHRGGFAAVRVIRDFEQWAKSRGARYTFLAQTTGINPDRTKRWCEKLGYNVVGYITRKDL